MKKIGIIVVIAIWTIILFVIGFGLGYQKGWRKTEIEATQYRIRAIKGELYEPMGSDTLKEFLRVEECRLQELVKNPLDMIIPLPGGTTIYISEYGIKFFDELGGTGYNGLWFPMALLLLAVLVSVLILMVSMRKTKCTSQECSTSGR